MNGKLEQRGRGVFKILERAPLPKFTRHSLLVSAHRIRDSVVTLLPVPA